MPDLIPKIHVDAAAQKVTLKVVGYIQSMSEEQLEAFRAEALAAQGQGIQNVEVYINSMGGDVFAANEMRAIIQSFFGERRAIIGAVCASAAMTVASACQRVEAQGRFSQLMFHRPSIGAYGNVDDIESTVALGKSLEDDMAQYLASWSGQTTDWIRSSWKADFWMGASKAKELGFVHAILSNDERISETQARAALGDKSKGQLPVQVAAVVEAPQPKPSTMDKLELVAAALDLPEGATQKDVTAKVKGLLKTNATLEKANADLKAENETLKKAEADAQKTRITDLVDAAVSAGKITAAKKERFVKLATADFDSTKELLDEMPARESLAGKVNGKGGADAKAEARKDWTFEDYQKKDPKALAAMKQSDPERFKELFNATYSG